LMAPFMPRAAAWQHAALRTWLNIKFTLAPIHII
jgi:hypothetical protein